MTVIIADTEIGREPQDSEVVLSVEGVSKKFCRSLKRSLFYGVQDIATELVGGRRKSEALRPEEFWALKDVSLELQRGEALGLIGPNGSGKTTLLRIISGLIKPDTGSVKVRGRVAPLIALGAGFNPILTGRENIYVNMSILGLSKKEINERFDAVVEFAEIGDAIDAPVQTYSSGMAARLGFASAIYTEPDILLIDEVLAVGDLKFRIKCYRQLAHLRKRGTSFILVSHNPQSILSVCNSAVYLLRGKLLVAGDAASVMHRYEQELFLKEVDQSTGVMYLPEKPAIQSSGLDITTLYFKDEEGNILQSPLSGKPIYFCVRCKAHRKIYNAILSISIREQFGESECILSLSSERDNKFIDISPENVELQLQMPYCGLKPGVYVMKVWISERPHYVYDVVESFNFQVKSTESMSQCLFYQPRFWRTLSDVSS